MAQILTPTHSFTIRFDGITNRIISKAKISEAFDPKGDPSKFPSPIEVNALWDTGATRSVITGQTAKLLNIPSTGVQLVRHGGGQTEHKTYVVNLILPNGVAFSGVVVTELENVEDDFGLIIGMDVIAGGDFSITNHRGKSCFSFRYPSIHTIDYVEEFNSKLRQKVGPNDPCPCGAKDKKFKKCHGARG